MAGPNYVLDKAFKSRDVLATPYLGVRQFSVTEVELPNAVGNIPLGIAQEAVDQAGVDGGQHMNVRVAGTSFAVAGEAIAVNDPVRLGTDGKVYVADLAGDARLGLARSAATAVDQYVIVYLNITGTVV